MTDKINIEIDGRSCEARPGEMIIAVADREGIPIPRFCYHKKLSIAANCRMCLVEAEVGGRPAPKPMPACATPVGEGMKVRTRSAGALEAQRGTMEFLLINHPLDCPICDQGGECELQDVAMGFGGDVSRFAERKRVVKDEDLGPLIATDMTRCIHCTRCVRFGAEIAGVRELGATGRGEEMRIGTFVAHTVSHELSGNVIDLCPVGALTSKPYRFSARAWELKQYESIAPHDAVGSNLYLHVRGNRVMRVHPRDNESVNETWIADRDRFSYEGLNGPDRLTAPLIKRDGIWREVDWTQALDLVAERLRAADPATTGWVLSPTATLEELYLAQRIARGLGGHNLDHRLRQCDFRGDAADPPVSWLGLPIAELEQQSAVLAVGSDPRQEQPLLAHRLRKAALAEANIAFVNPLRLDLTHPATQCVGTPAGMIDHLAAIAQAAGVSGAPAIHTAIQQRIRAAEPDETHRALAAALAAGGAADRGIVLLGALAAAHPDYAFIRALATALAAATGCRFGMLPAAANSVGAVLAGALPHRLPGAQENPTPGLNLMDLCDAAPKTLILWGVEPDLDLLDPARAMRACGGADTLIACTAFRSASLDAVADVQLPIGAFAETSGTFVNAAGTWQSFQGAVAPPGESRPGWKVLRVLGNLLRLPGFEYVDSRQIRDELSALCGDLAFDGRPDTRQAFAPDPPQPGLTRIGWVPRHAADPLVRRAPALARTPVPGGRFGVYLHPRQAADMGFADGAQVSVSQGGGRARGAIILDDRIPLDCVGIPSGLRGAETLGLPFGPVEIAPLVDDEGRSANQVENR